MDEDCDPQAFIAATERQYQITGKNKTAHLHLMIDKSAGLASMGNFEEALEVLLSLDLKRVKRSKMRRLVFYNNLMLCYDGLNQQEQAKELYDTEFCVYSANLRQFKIVKAVILFSKLKYENFEDEIQMRLNIIGELKSMKLSKRLSLHLKLYESELAILQNDLSLGEVLLKEVAVNGNKLHLVKIAQERLSSLVNNSL